MKITRLALIIALIQVTAITVATLYFVGPHGESFSPLNHFISEIGDPTLTSKAWVFNYTLIVTGALIYWWGKKLQQAHPKALGDLHQIISVVVALSIILMGVFNRHYTTPHRSAAFTGFIATVVWMLYVVYKIVTRKIILKDEYYKVMLLLLTYNELLLGAVFVPRYDAAYQKLILTGVLARPKFWIITVLEWMLYLTVLLWLLSISLGTQEDVLLDKHHNKSKPNNYNRDDENQKTFDI